MQIIEKGSQRYILDPESGQPVKFDPWIHEHHRTVEESAQLGTSIPGSTPLNPDSLGPGGSIS